MKRFRLLLLMAFVAFTCSAQKPLSYSKVIQKEGMTAQQLYEASKNWFARTFVDSKAVMRDATPGKELTGKGKLVFSTNMMYSSIQGYIGYLIDIQFKDGRMKFTMSDFRHEPSHEAKYDNHMGVLVDSLPKDLKDIGVEGMNRKASYKYYFKNGIPLCEKQFKELSESLEEFIDKREESKDDW
ncbi:DUF4468 domain-containing protein [Prevotella sp. HUN102]|uniref:DUF4468 domain-containing protein n=1 Tax=Prevotella sp. HUN102 TaxID=1392486 RepID=UPI0009E05B0B|nr:DUF4468 domain-containing protein [Prevotella sp. HUN102]